ncbi:MAG: ASPIC/UnbV domain-containing protein, partial [Thermoanaerobaculia bacterium]
LGLALRGPAGNPEGVGAAVTLEAGGRRQRRWVTAGDSYQSASERRALFGAGDGVEPESVAVDWPDGGRWRLLAPPADRYLVVPR